MRLLLTALLLTSCGQKAQEIAQTPTAPLPTKVILLMGQSNMEGRPTSPGPTIAQDLSAYFGTAIGYIQCAKGSTSIDQWTSSLFQNCLNKVHPKQTVLAVFWYQGESDAYSYASASNWGVKFSALNSNFTAPVIYAQLASLGPSRWSDPRFSYWATVQASQAALNGLMVYTQDLPLSSDDLHLSTQSAIEVGHRMAQRYIGAIQ